MFKIYKIVVIVCNIYKHTCDYTIICMHTDTDRHTQHTHTKHMQRESAKQIKEEKKNQQNNSICKL